ncbi:hypothetical protein N7451_008475 [Penicillium sp. IBT 35674x]|nr:hypothetical protein N7451_008475 [Penicillium sp. IBT 35674x]
MLAKSFLLLCAAATTAVADNNLQFIYDTSSFSSIQGSGSGATAGFAIGDNDGNVFYSSSDPGGYSPCKSNSEKIEITSDCWDGTWTFGCTSKFDGNPKECSAFAPDGTYYSGTAKSSLSFIGIAAGSDGSCSGGFYAPSESCSSDSTFTVTNRYRGDYSG